MRTAEGTPCRVSPDARTRLVMSLVNAAQRGDREEAEAIKRRLGLLHPATPAAAARTTGKPASDLLNHIRKVSAACRALSAEAGRARIDLVLSPPGRPRPSGRDLDDDAWCDAVFGEYD